MFLFRFVSFLNRIKNKDVIVTCFTYAMNALKKEERMVVKKKNNNVVMQKSVVKFRWHFKLLNLGIKPLRFTCLSPSNKYFTSLSQLVTFKKYSCTLTFWRNKLHRSFGRNDFLNGVFSIVFFTDCFLFGVGRWNWTKEARVTEHCWWLWLQRGGIFLGNRWLSASNGRKAAHLRA